MHLNGSNRYLMSAPVYKTLWRSVSSLSMNKALSSALPSPSHIGILSWTFVGYLCGDWEVAVIQQFIHSIRRGKGPTCVCLQWSNSLPCFRPKHSKESLARSHSLVCCPYIRFCFCRRVSFVTNPGHPTHLYILTLFFIYDSCFSYLTIFKYISCWSWRAIHLLWPLFYCLSE